MITASHNLRCLLVRQPYASLIAYGLKRIEFRGYATQVRGRIGIAASKGPPFRTCDPTVNSMSREWPRGLVLGTAVLLGCEVWGIDRLRESLTGESDILVHGTKLRVYGSPVGEPLADVDSILCRSEWQSWGWVLSDVTTLSTPMPYAHAGRSTWGTMPARF
jgi:hypothetical protein